MSMFESEYRNRINKVVEFIEENSDSKLTLEILAGHAGISPFHLHRLFLIYTGEPISGFIRRIRLASGFYRVQKGKKSSIIEIAVAAGYDSVSSYIRSFRKRFGFTPASSTEFNDNTLSLWLTQKAETKKIVAEPSRIELRVHQIIFGIMGKGYQNRSFQKVAEATFKQAIKLADANNLNARMGRACAVMFEDPDLVNPTEVKYFGGFELLGSDAIACEGLETLTVKPGTYAVFIHNGSYKNLWQSWNVAYRNWLPNSGYRLGDAFPFEIYINDPRTVRQERDLITEIYIPIEVR